MKSRRDIEIEQNKRFRQRMEHCDLMTRADADWWFIYHLMDDSERLIAKIVLNGQGAVVDK